jgi:hypothetical protein
MVALTPGEYQVYAWWTEFSNRFTSVPYDVQYRDGTDTVTVDQTINGGRWNLLGAWQFDTAATITIRSLGAGITSADAVRLVRVGDAGT